MVWRMPLTDTRSLSRPAITRPPDGRDAEATGTARACAVAAGAATTGALGREAVFSMAVSTSRLMMRPPGPLPCSDPSAMPCSSAMRRATGLTRTRWPPTVTLSSSRAAGVACDGATLATGALGAAETAFAATGAALPPPIVALSRLSPSSAITAICVPTFTD